MSDRLLAMGVCAKQGMSHGRVWGGVELRNAWEMRGKCAGKETVNNDVEIVVPYLCKSR